MMRLTVALGLIVAGLAPSLAADAPAAPVRIEMTAEGPVFVTTTGMTLYTYISDDTTPGKSQCSNVPKTEFPDPSSGFGNLPLASVHLHPACTEKWPPFMADESAKAGGDWGFITRTEGGKQWTYRGRPLYTSVKDKKTGDINGAFSPGQLRGWRLASAPLNFPPGLKIYARPEGMVIATLNERPAYTPESKNRAKSELFQPLLAPSVGHPIGDWSIVDAGAGRYQYAFRGKPLYAAPAQMSDSEIAEAGGWETVVFHKSAGTPAAIGSRTTVMGDVFTDKSGKTLYVFTCSNVSGDGVRCDDPGDPAIYWSALCSSGEECARRWQPYVAAADAAPVGDWSIVEVAQPMFTDATARTYPPGTPRVKAWAYRGRPAYTYYKDKEPGDIWGHSLRWFGFSGFYALQVPGRGMQD